MANDTVYKLLEGVHRCVAAHILRLTTIRARVDTNGSLGPVQMIPLNRIFSTKPEIARWDHRRDFHVLLRIMSDAAWRDALDPVELVRIPSRLTSYFTAIEQITLHDIDVEGWRTNDEH